MTKKTRSKTRGRTRAENAIGARESEGRQEKWPHSCCRPQAAAKGAPLQTPPEGESALSVFGCRLCVAGGAEGERRQAADRPTLAPTLCVCVPLRDTIRIRIRTSTHAAHAHTHAHTHPASRPSAPGPTTLPPPVKCVCCCCCCVCVPLPCPAERTKKGTVGQSTTAQAHAHTLYLATELCVSWCRLMGWTDNDLCPGPPPLPVRLRERR